MLIVPWIEWPGQITGALWIWDFFTLDNLFKGFEGIFSFRLLGTWFAWTSPSAFNRSKRGPIQFLSSPSIRQVKNSFHVYHPAQIRMTPNARWAAILTLAVFDQIKSILKQIRNVYDTKLLPDPSRQESRHRVKLPAGCLRNQRLDQHKNPDQIRRTSQRVEPDYVQWIFQAWDRTANSDIYLG